MSVEQGVSHLWKGKDGNPQWEAGEEEEGVRKASSMALGMLDPA